MYDYNDYKKINELEKRLFKYSDDDLIDILIKNQDLIEEFYSSTPQEITEKMKNINYEKIAELLIDSLFDDEINRDLESLEEYEVKTIVKDNFPFEEPRELQLETISKIYDAIEQGYKFIVLEAVSGFGKSLIAATLSNIYSKEQSYILTVNNQLANQYLEDFKNCEIGKLNPRSTFYCEHGGKCGPYKCKYSECDYYYSDLKKDFEEDAACEYLYQLKEGLKSNSVICTYDFFIKENFYHSNYLKPRKLLICDEGHNIDEKISKSTSLEIFPKRFDEDMELDRKNEYDYITQNEDYYYYLLKFRKMYENRLKEEDVANNELYIQLKKRLDDLTKFMSYFNKNNENFSFEIGSKKNWIFRPVKVNKIINDALLNFGDVCIFMSSSIFDHENFAFDIGIDKNEIYSIRVPNIFDLSKNPIRIYSEFDMSGDPIETGAAESSLSAIKQILKKHNNEKGVIHTSNYEQVNYIMDKINSNRFVKHYSTNREAVLKDFKNSDEPLVLVSPSMNEGVDLPGELCRFQIIFKLPYLPFKQPWIEKRENLYEDGKEWYDYKMLTKLIQGYGRGIRFEGDYCKTYILDNRLFDVINKDIEGSEIIPKYFINAIENFNQDI
jgi:Rad3-related DNA helicase